MSRFTSLRTAVTQGRRIGGMSHRAACGWIHVHVGSGPVRSCGPVSFAVTVSGPRGWSVKHVRFRTTCIYRTIYLQRYIQDIHNGTHTVETSQLIRFSNESCHVDHNGMFPSTRLSTLTAVKRSADNNNNNNNTTTYKAP